MRVRWFVGVLALGVGLPCVTGCGDSSNAAPAAVAPPAEQAATEEEKQEGPPEDAIAIKVGEVERGSLSSIYATSATLRAEKQATTTARTQGVIRQLLVEEGDWVEEGQPLAVLEDDEQKIAFNQARSNADIQRREAERARTLHEQDLLSEEEYETARREAVDSEHVAELAQLTLSRTVIRATFSGRVLTRHLDVGATVSDGTPVYDIADLDPLYADVQVPERQVSELSPEQAVRLTTESNDDSIAARARIERIAPAVDPTTGTVKVTITIDQAEGLRPGSFVRVGIVIDTHENTLVVPRSALVAEGRRWHLFRIKEDDPYAVELIEVERGFEEADRVEILGVTDAEQVLHEGDSIVTTGASSLSDESAVHVIEDAPAADERADAEEDSAEATAEGGGEQGVAA